MSIEPFTVTRQVIAKPAGGTVAVATVSTDQSNLFCHYLKLSNPTGSAGDIRISQKRHSNAFDDRTNIPANNAKSFGGSPTARLLNFDRAGTILAAIDATGGTIDVTMGLTE